MAREIERKFKVQDLSILTRHPCVPHRIIQGYLCVTPVTRVRIMDEAQAFLTIKGPSDGNGACDEFEYSIPVADGLAMLPLCADRVIDKTRYVLPAGNGLVFELDVFHGRHAGLAVVEIELPSRDTPVALPDWVGAELTGDFRYANAYMATHPFDPELR